MQSLSRGLGALTFRRVTRDAVLILPAAVPAVCGGAGELREAVGRVLLPGRPAGRAAVPEKGPDAEREAGPRSGQGAVNNA